MGKVATENTLLGIGEKIGDVITREAGERMAAALEAIAAATKRTTITINMVGTSGAQAFVEGYAENIVVTNPTTGTILFVTPYMGQPVEVELAQGTTYEITGTQVHLAETRFYAPTTATGVAQSDKVITIVYQELDTANSLMAIQEVVRANPGKEIFPIGTEVTIPYTIENGTTYDWTWVVTHYGYAVKEEDKDTRKKTWGMYLMAKESNHVNVQFDNAETEAATETYADGSLFYYGKTGNNYTLLQLSQGDPVPYSDYDAVYHNEIKDTSFNILRYGYNRYSHSAQRQYINSDADVGQWWEAQHIGDVAPSSLLSCAGMLHGFRDSDKAALTAIEVTTLLNTVTDKDIGTSEKTYDKMFLPSTKEMFGTDQTTVEGDSWSEYWKGFVGMAAATDATDSKRIIRAFNAKTIAQYCRLRSARRGTAYNAWTVNTAGSLSTSSASLAYRPAPACFIC